MLGTIVLILLTTQLQLRLQLRCECREFIEALDDFFLNLKRWKGDGKGWGVKGVKGDWKMGMISDCYQLQENQRKNGPLTVKTPPPCTGSPPAWWMQGGRWWAHCLRLLLRRRRSLPPALPLPCFPLRGRSQAGRKSRKALRVNGSGRMLKRYKFQHSLRRR